MKGDHMAEEFNEQLINFYHNHRGDDSKVLIDAIKNVLTLYGISLEEDDGNGE